MANTPVRKAVSEFSRRIDAEYAALASQGQLRKLGEIKGVNLCSNDYLGLSSDPRLRDAVASALAAGVPVASAGSRLLSGNAEAWERKRFSISIRAIPRMWVC